MTTPELFKLKLRSNEHFAHGAIYHGCILAAQVSVGRGGRSETLESPEGLV